jgi:hypothetical protein
VIRLKQTLGLAGLLVSLLGIALNRRWVIWIAIALLASSLLLRLAQRHRARDGDADATPDEGTGQV